MNFFIDAEKTRFFIHVLGHIFNEQDIDELDAIENIGSNIKVIQLSEHAIQNLNYRYLDKLAKFCNTSRAALRPRFIIGNKNKK